MCAFTHSITHILYSKAAIASKSFSELSALLAFSDSYQMYDAVLPYPVIESSEFLIVGSGATSVISGEGWIGGVFVGLDKDQSPPRKCNFIGIRPLSAKKFELKLASLSHARQPVRKSAALSPPALCHLCSLDHVRAIPFVLRDGAGSVVHLLPLPLPLALPTSLGGHTL